MNIRTRSGISYPYGPNKRGLQYGLDLDLPDAVPETIRDAEAAVKHALTTETEAHTAVGAAARAIATAQADDARARGQALADGKPAPKRKDTATLTTALADAEANARAATHAVDICRTRLEAALTAAKSDGTLAAAIATISAEADTDITNARDHLAAAQASRDAAARKRSLERSLDAWPNGPHDANGAPTSMPDEWRAALAGVGRDLDVLEEALAHSVLTTRPDLQAPQGRATKDEGSF